jgi:hypothetical protein
MLIEICKPSCLHWEDRLRRCEARIEEVNDYYLTSDRF